MRPYYAIFRKPVCRALLVGLVTLGGGVGTRAQQSGGEQKADTTTLQILMTRIDQLEARVRQLEADKQQATAGTSTSPEATSAATTANPPFSSEQPVAGTPASQQEETAQIPPVPATEADQTQSENVMTDRMDMSKTLLRIRGFGDVSLHGDTQKGDTTTFSLGQLDLFVTSDVSEKFKFLSEIVFEAGPDNIYGSYVGQENTFTVDIERYQMLYSLSDYLNIWAGRGHTAIGYYNTAYHHSTWLQTTVDRPLLFQFEDRGGILPVHMVGVSASGIVPTEKLGLHYVAEVGNGRESRNPLGEEPVQNQISDLNHKAFNLATFVRPTAVPGLQAGFSVYHDLLAPEGQAKIGETIMAAHAVVIRPRWEWLNEVVLDRHAPAGSSVVYHTPGFYTQASRQFGAYRPYFRYQYLNAPRKEPVFPDIALQHGPSLGLRYDASEFVALKFQYDYRFLRDQPGVNGLTLQLGFTF